MSRVVLAIAAAGVLAGCSVSASIGDTSVSTDNLEAKVGQLAGELFGSVPDSVTCDGPLESDEGSTQQCTITDGDESATVDVTSTGLSGDQVGFEIEVFPNE